MMKTRRRGLPDRPGIMSERLLPSRTLPSIPQRTFPSITSLYLILLFFTSLPLSSPSPQFSSIYHFPFFLSFPPLPYGLPFILPSSPFPSDPLNYNSLSQLFPSLSPLPFTPLLSPLFLIPPPFTLGWPPFTFVCPPLPPFPSACLVPQSTYIDRVQSSVWRLQNYRPPTHTPPSEYVLPMHNGGGYTLAVQGRAWGVNILEDARHWIGLLQYNSSTLSSLPVQPPPPHSISRSVLAVLSLFLGQLEIMLQQG